MKTAIDSAWRERFKNADKTFLGGCVSRKITSKSHWYHHFSRSSNIYETMYNNIRNKIEKIEQIPTNLWNIKNNNKTWSLEAWLLKKEILRPPMMETYLPSRPVFNEQASVASLRVLSLRSNESYNT